MTKFEIGKQYKMRSACDHECVWTFTVVDRTAKTVTITDGNEIRKCKIAQKETEWSGHESVYPLGKYSLCPILRAK